MTHNPIVYVANVYSVVSRCKCVRAIVGRSSSHRRRHFSPFDPAANRELMDLHDLHDQLSDTMDDEMDLTDDFLDTLDVGL
jgi:hypothetical protein